MGSSFALWLIPFFLLFANAQPPNKPTPGSIVVVGDTIVSAMMMFLGSEKKVYIIDKVEGNPTTINGHPVWAAEWDIATGVATPMDMRTNAFCAAGSHAPNGSYWIFGGNGAITVGGGIGAQKNPDGVSGAFDPVYGDSDGGAAIRRIDPCLNEHCEAVRWFDDGSINMATKRWYPAAEALPDGSVVIVGGFVNGGYVNRNTPNVDPAREGGAAEPTYEFFPSRGVPQVMSFMTTTSGLNSYAHTFLMPSGKIFVQANLSTILWDYENNIETPLPQMPNNAVRVYPASGGAAMLPLTPANNYTPTIIFCGGNSEMQPDDYGNYSAPLANPWEKSASKDCQRITPEPTDGSQPAYTQDDDMLTPRTMGQFIVLPDQTFLMINGAANGTAGYSDHTGSIHSLDQMPFDMSLASNPVMKPAIYDPAKPAGMRWSTSGLSESQIPRMYHSSALLLPDGSVMVAGSNPNVDYNISRIFKTEYRAEYFYPPYFSASVRPKPKGIPKTLSYGGDMFNLSLDVSSFTGPANDAAGNTTVVVIRPGWTTHGMNMGQRCLQLNNTFTVADDGTITLHVAQPPPNPNLMTPGPMFLFVVVGGVPSVASMVTVGNGQIGTQPIAPATVLPPSTLSSKNVAGSGSPSSTGAGGSSGNSSGPPTGVIIAAVVGGVAAIAIAGAFVGIVITRRRRAVAARRTIIGGITRTASMGRGYHDNKEASTLSDPVSEVGYNDYTHASTGSEDAFIPLRQYSQADLHVPPPMPSEWTPSQQSLHHGSPPAGAYGAQSASGYYSGQSQSQGFNPYEQQRPGQGQSRYL